MIGCEAHLLGVSPGDDSPFVSRRIGDVPETIGLHDED
jgi:hypothetical protein